MPKLTIEKANEIAGALSDIKDLSTKAIIETSDAARKRGLEAFIAREATENIAELLGNWFAMQNQYVPLIRGFAGLIASANGLLGQVAKDQQATAEPVSETKS